MAEGRVDEIKYHPEDKVIISINTILNYED